MFVVGLQPIGVNYIGKNPNRNDATPIIDHQETAIAIIES
jgi:hypothetical protein